MINLNCVIFCRSLIDSYANSLYLVALAVCSWYEFFSLFEAVKSLNQQGCKKNLHCQSNEEKASEARYLVGSGKWIPKIAPEFQFRSLQLSVFFTVFLPL